MLKTTLLLFSSSLLMAENFSSSISSQGFTGLINTPNAQVIDEGKATFHFNNQFDNHLRYYDYNNRSAHEENYVAGLGLVPNFEVIGRLVEVGKLSEKGKSDFSVRDLSANFKYKIPYSHKYLPDIAIGLQDFGGVANHYINNYIVMDKSLGFLRASLGYGKAGDELVKGNRMDGVFGGV
ncbi:MAG TPA: hypothetical protein ENK82_10195, partial [Campylobacterales bacterium]|nr:hypothetical protein [Campylobacterales bacterium]